MSEKSTLTLILIGVALLVVADIYAYKEASAASQQITAATSGATSVITALENIV